MTMSIRGLRIERPLSKTEERRLWALLPPARAARLEGVRQAEKRQEVLCAYGLLAVLLRERYGWETFPEVEVTREGKPFFPAAAEVYVSLSHTAGAVLAGADEAPVGVDIERLRPVSPRLLRRMDAPDGERFIWDWVRREALAKQSGDGFGALLKEPKIPADGCYTPLTLFDGYAAGVAACRPVFAADVSCLRLEELL